MRQIVGAALLILPLLSPPARAWFGKKKSKPVYVDVDDGPAEPVGMKDPEEELDEITQRIARGELPKIQFDFDSAEIRLESRPTLDAIGSLMLRNPKLKLMIIAHTCRIGTERYNLDLSRRRAKSVMTYLAQMGVPPPFMRYRGMGFSRPIADNSTEKGREKNRRVEFRVTFRDWNAIY